ncbi:Vinculin family-domain-containing protein [Blyttiomyces helicus]|uniref:Vinculin family-domain-containing protein n=1 Tax=Blyttiomyces helicus TaxID=388810 RepID=A0A4P9WH07_9FUNG|nr:Vinculin family-domain-containing protein [Blyttiomyces helicus]|eukprot:RKO92004.1 Vinculin family-domain-containing protein [Blyttiomyces helicus]
MHTTTSKAVLSPLADAVTALIVIVSDAEATGGAIPNLTALGAEVDRQIANLVAIGKKIEGQPSADEQLKKEMPKACADGGFDTCNFGEPVAIASRTALVFCARKVAVLLTDMLHWSRAVSAASKLLLTSTTTLAADPHSAEGRGQLLQSVKGILASTTEVLTVFDDAEVRKILAACALLRKRIGVTLEGVAIQGGTQAHVQSIAATSQAVVALGQITTKRVGELLFPVLQARLRAAIRVLTKESPLLVSACKCAIMNPSAEGPKVGRDGSCQRLVEATKEIEIVVLYKTEEEGFAFTGGSGIGKIRKLLSEEYKASIIAATRGSPQGLNAALQQYAKGNAALLAHAKAALKEISDPVQRAQIEKVLASLAIASKAAHEAAYEAQAHPNDPRKQQALVEALDAAAVLQKTLATLLNRGLVSDLGTLLSTLSNHTEPQTTLGKLHTAAISGDSAGLPAAIAVFEADGERLGRLASAAMDVAPAHLAQDVRMARDRLAQLVPAVRIAAKMVAEKPGDQSGQEFYKGVVSAWEEGIKDMESVLLGQEGVFAGDELLIGTKNAFDYHAKTLADAAAKGDIPETHKSAASLLAASQQFLAFAKKEAENTEDAAYRRELEVQIREVETVLPRLLTSARILLSNSDSSSVSHAASDLNSIIGEMARKMGTLGDAIRGYKGTSHDVLEYVASVVQPPPPKIEKKEVEKTVTPVVAAKKEKELADKMADLVIVEQAAPVPLTEAEAKANPIKAAGQELAVEAATWVATSNPIVQEANTLSATLLALSANHAELTANPSPATKKAFITTAQSITTTSTALAERARILASACTDRRLRAQLLATVERIISLAQQMKIVAAVKASAPKDRDRDSQLIACAGNIMEAVKACLRECESASLRVRVGEGGGLRFQRAVYRGKQV